MSGLSDDTQRRRGLRREAIVDFVTHPKFRSTDFRAVLTAAKERIQQDRPNTLPDASQRRRQHSSGGSDALLGSDTARGGVGSGAGVVGSGYEGDMAWATRAQFIRVLRNAGFDSRTDLRYLNRLFSSYDIDAKDAMDMVWFCGVMDRYQKLTEDGNPKSGKAAGTGKTTARKDGASDGDGNSTTEANNTVQGTKERGLGTPLNQRHGRSGRDLSLSLGSAGEEPPPRQVRVGGSAVIPKNSPSAKVLKRSPARDTVNLRSLSPGRQAQGRRSKGLGATMGSLASTGFSSTQQGFAATSHSRVSAGRRRVKPKAATSWVPITQRITGDPRPIRRNSIRRAETHMETFDLGMFYED